MTCFSPGCDRLDTEPVTVSLVDPADVARDATTYELCPEHRDRLLHRFLTLQTPPPDDWDWEA